MTELPIKYTPFAARLVFTSAVSTCLGGKLLEIETYGMPGCPASEQGTDSAVDFPAIPLGGTFDHTVRTLVYITRIHQDSDAMVISVTKLDTVSD